MPDEPAAYPNAVVDRAIEICELVARQLNEDLIVRAGLIDDADDWSGGHRNDFDDVWRNQQEVGLVDVRDKLLTLAGRLMDERDTHASTPDER